MHQRERRRDPARTPYSLLLFCLDTDHTETVEALERRGQHFAAIGDFSRDRCASSSRASARRQAPEVLASLPQAGVSHPARTTTPSNSLAAPLGTAAKPRQDIKPDQDPTGPAEARASYGCDACSLGRRESQPAATPDACLGRRMKIKGSGAMFRSQFAMVLAIGSVVDPFRGAADRLLWCGFDSSVGRRARFAGFSPARGPHRRAGGGL